MHQQGKENYERDVLKCNRKATQLDVPPKKDDNLGVLQSNTWHLYLDTDVCLEDV
jgi:hypothetical protein